MGSSAMLVFAVITAVSVTSARDERSDITSMLQDIGNILLLKIWPVESVVEEVGKIVPVFTARFHQTYPQANFAVLLDELCREILYKKQGHPEFGGCMAVLDQAVFHGIWLDVLSKLTSEYLVAVGNDLLLGNTQLPTARKFIESAQGKQLTENVRKERVLHVCNALVAQFGAKKQQETLTLDDHFRYYASRHICMVKRQQSSASSSSSSVPHAKLPWP